ncbi:MAG: hypothetical protein COB29_04440 [Sulfitobacter sp.]|nr:MAG: hypothetical protein COB29_04440 [Sulfitobacter sp.]
MVTISLTTTRDRLYLLRFTLISLMEQSFKADKIVVWLSRDAYLRDRGLGDFNIQSWAESRLPYGYANNIEFRYCENIGPYRKLIPMLKTCSFDDVIVTADDDIVYKKNWLKSLIEKFDESEGCVVACRVRRVSYNFLGFVKSYSFWPIVHNKSFLDEDFAITFGAGAVVSPAFFSRSDVNDDSFLNLCPTADDLWYTALLKNNNVGVEVVPETIDSLIFLSHDDGLVNDNLLPNKSGIHAVLYRFKISILARLGVPVCANDIYYREIGKHFLSKGRSKGGCA